MAEKAKIEYVGQFYVHGSEAPKVQPLVRPKKKQSFVPAPRREPVRVISVDPVALCGMLVAVVMVAALVIGAMQITATWKEYDAVERYLSKLKQENSLLDHTYHTSFDLEEIRTNALAMGMIPAEEARTIAVEYEIPQPEPRESWWEGVVWFLKGLFSQETVGVPFTS